MEQCCCNHDQQPTRRRPSVIGSAVKLLVIYSATVFAGGTLMNTNQSVAVEAGRLMQTVTFVDPAIHWAQTHGYQRLERSLTFLAHGLPLKSCGAGSCQDAGN
jgi:hypothetical protein